MLCPVDMAGPQSRLMQQVDQFQSTQVHKVPPLYFHFLPHLVWPGTTLPPLMAEGCVIVLNILSKAEPSTFEFKMILERKRKV